MANPYGDGHESVTISEHISPRKTGDNIEAKRVAGYVFNPTTLQWQRDANVDPATKAKQDEQIALATTLNALNITLQKTVLSWDKVHKLLQETRDGYTMRPDYVEASNSQNVSGAVSVSGSLTTVSTVTTVGNQTNIGGFSADMMAEGSSFQDWGISIRSNII